MGSLTGIGISNMRCSATVSLSLGILMLCLVSCSKAMACQNSTSKAAVGIGDYIVLGSYLDEPILWRCVDIDPNGQLMLSDRIICLKPFDATGVHVYQDGTPQNDPNGDRAVYGSNLWETSDLRAWLNSTEPAGQVIWTDGSPPIRDAVFGGYNEYAEEKGFLAEGNFTATEIQAIKPVKQRSLLNIVDVDVINGYGTQLHRYDQGIDSAVQNYEQAYGHDLIDRLFLPDIAQIHRVWENSQILGGNYCISHPTLKAVDNSDYSNKNLDPDKSWHYWLRTPSSHPLRTSSVRYVFFGKSINGNSAFSGCVYGMGVRPAFYLDADNAEITTGCGSLADPYKVKG